MSDDPAGAIRRPTDSEHPGDPRIWGAQAEHLYEAECLRLISGGGVGRMAYNGQYGLTVLPVSYRLIEGCIVVRTPLGSTTDEDLRTGIRGANYRVTFEIDQVGHDAQEGWFVIIQGPARHVDAYDDCLSAWVPAPRSSEFRRPDHFVRITPSLITGRRLSREHGDNLLHHAAAARITPSVAVRAGAPAGSVSDSADDSRDVKPGRRAYRIIHQGGLADSVIAAENQGATKAVAHDIQQVIEDVSLMLAVD
jgi:nitroimidazol reductase NimA-like FMN-containing flavoprotein (pyridoxamine 5'-phosphate oxidase superfamily)